MAKIKKIIGKCVAEWRRLAASLLLLIFSFQVGSPTALALWEIRTAQAADFGGAISSAISSLFGQSGAILEKFDSKGSALQSQAAVKNKPRFDLVAILVEESLTKSNQSYDGLRSAHNPTVPNVQSQAYRKLNEQTLMERIDRYARDVQGINQVKDPTPYLKTVVLKVKAGQPTEEISAALEKLYREGDGTANEVNRLAGIVLIGDVPLPVVNKNGNRFVSIFPYTDFDDPYYVYDPDSGDFVVGEDTDKPGVEIWHGVIRPPVGGEEGNRLLAEYLDKNHLFKVGEPGYSEFEKKLFYSDLNKEFDLMGAEGLPSYFSYLKYWEDISYFRFNKTWAQKLQAESPLGKPEGDGFDNDGDGKIDEDPVNGYDDDGDGEPGSPLHGLINGIDDDGDGEIDNDEEGVWGFCSPIPPTGPTKLENCQAAGQPYKTNDYYNTKPGSFYKVMDNVNNNAADDLRVDEGIDEDDGDAFLGVDNDRDGRVDEDTSQDNDADGDLKSDEDGPGDMNGDGCPGVCGVDEDNDSIDGDGDGWPKGYEEEYGSLSLGLGGLGNLIDAVSGGSNIKEAFASMKSSTNHESFWDFPLIMFSPPIGPPFPFPRFMPWPDEEEWIDEGNVNDDDEDGLVDEDGTADNDNDQDGRFDEDPGDALGTGGKTNINPFEQLPDIRSKDIIMNFFKKYNQLFDKFYADINTWIDGTGRYEKSYKSANDSNLSDLVTFPFLIAAKDEFTRIYLKAVNDAIEKRIDQYVQKLQYDIQLVKGATLRGYVILPDNNGVFPPGAKIRFDDINFINFGYSNAVFDASLEAFLEQLKQLLLLAPNTVEDAMKLFLETLKGPVTAATPIYINGKSIDAITNIEECSLYRGSEGSGEQSQMVYANTVFDPASNLNTELPPQMPQSWNNESEYFRLGDEDNDYHGAYWWWGNDPDWPMVKWMEKQRLLNKAFAGCFSANANESSRCFPTLATRYIFSLGGSRQVTNVPKSAVSHQACFDLKEKNGYDSFALNANIYLKNLLNKVTEVEKKALDPQKPSAASAYRQPKFISLLDFVNNPPADFEISPTDTAPIPPNLVDSAANDATLGALKVSLEDVLLKFAAGNRRDDNGNGQVDEPAEAGIQFFVINPSDNQPNWLQVGEHLLQNPRNNEAATEANQKPLLFANGVIPGTKTVEVRVYPLVGKTISSLVFHKEPTIDTVQAQTYELKRDAKGNLIEDSTLTPQEKKTLGKYEVATKTMKDPNDPNKTIEVKKETRNTLSIPIDSPRYVSFRDANGDYREIVYPNAFQAASLADLQKELQELEQQLAAMEVNPLYANVGPASVEGYLTGVLQDFLSNDVINTANDEVSIVASRKLDDALQWKGMDLDRKHQYALTHYWGSGLSPFTPLSEAEEGYEVLYLNSAGDANALAMKFNKDIPPPAQTEQVENVDCTRAENAYKLACREAAGGGTGEEDGGADMTPVFLTEWFQKLAEWAEETADIINGKGAVLACPAGGFTDLPNSGPVDTTVYNPVTVVSIPLDLDGNGIPDQADGTIKLTIRLADPAKSTLRTGSNDQLKVIVEGLDKDGRVNTTDSSSEVKLTLTTVQGTAPVATIMGKDTGILASGQATFLLKAGTGSGTVSLQASLVTSSNVRSSQLPVYVTADSIKLMSYRRYNSYQFISGAQAGYSILDGNGNPIADVDPKTGRISVSSADYELRALPAEAEKPLRQAVVAKADSRVMAILYFVVGEGKPIVIDAPQVNFAEDFAKLPGARLKDLSAGDSLGLQSVNDEVSLKGNFYIVDASKTANQGRVGMVDRRGNVFTSLPLAVKAGTATDPVVFVIEDGQGNPAFELYAGSRFELITELPYESVKEFFTSAALLLARVTGEELTSNWLGQWLVERRIPRALAQANDTTADDTPLEGQAVDKNRLIIPDSDGDGLNDLEELAIGTDLNNKDSNGNGRTDLQDLLSGIDPRLEGRALFSDLQPAAEGFAEVIKLMRRGIMLADTQGRVRPKDNITREEFIKLDLGGICVICDRFSDKVKELVWKVYSSAPFPDSDIGEEYKYCVAEGKNRGIISGYKAFENVGYYVPKANISRAEATKVILETARQQIESFPDFVVNENLTGKPWYYNYVLTAQKEGFYPRGRFPELDRQDAQGVEDFKKYFDQQIILTGQGLPGGLANSQLMIWLNQPISRVEFAIMVSRFADKYNCLEIDQDGDGLPDNLEKYVYGTSPIDADTDGGGIKDGEEVLRGSDPLDPADDFPTAPTEEKPPVEPVVDPNGDPDGDGLTNALETEIGTDPNDPDTDQGGVKDGTEYLLGTDPLDAGDDSTSGSGSGLEEDGDGAYLSGIEIEPKTIYQLPEDDEAMAGNINTEETDRVPADGESVLYVRATLYGQDGAIKSDDNGSVIKFGFKNPEDGKFAALAPLNVKVKGGVAETVLTSKITTGLPIIIASVEGANYASDERLIDVHALDPAKATIAAVSPIIPSGGQTVTVLKAELRDRNGNLANAGSYTATFDLSHGTLAADAESTDDTASATLAQLENRLDEDKSQPGIQMTSVTGQYELRLTSGAEPEELKARINYQDPLQLAQAGVNNTTADLLNLGAQIFQPGKVTAETAISTRNDLRLAIRPQKLNLRADQRDSTELEVTVENSLGEPLAGFSGQVTLKMLNPKMGAIIDAEKSLPVLAKPLENGRAKFLVRSSLKAGDLVLTATVSGLPMISQKLNSQAYKATEIVLESDKLQVDADPAKIYTVKARLYDTAGNFVKSDNSTLLNFSVDPESAQFVQSISPTQMTATQGEAEFAFRTGTLTGPIRLRAKAKDLLDGTIEIEAVNNFQGRQFREIKPKFLYANLLGAAFGEATTTDYLGGWFVFSGKVQAATTMVTDPKPKVRLAEVTPAGKLIITDSGNLENSLQASGSDRGPVRQILTDLVSQKEILEVSIVPKSQSQIKQILSTEEADLVGETVNVLNLVPENTSYTLQTDENKISLLREGQLAATVGKDAQVILYSPTATLEAEDEVSSSAAVWRVSDLGTPVLRIYLGIGDTTDVKMLASDEKVPNLPGVYLKQLATLPKRSYVQSFSGNSSAAAKGFYYTDESRELDKSQGPGLNYLSLESAAEDDGIGLRGNNKNVLLFAAGNTVGQANLHYASDGGIVLGDPTVRLDNRAEPGTLDKLYSATGFTRDIGKMLLAGNAPIREINPIDFDNDGDKDLLIAHADGTVRLLENQNRGHSYQDRGDFLSFANGIISQAVLDLNDDGWEDLVVATADSCKVGEVCLDAYLNDRGNFVRSNLELDGYSAKNKIYMIRAADMNQDSYQDLVISDDTGNIRVFYARQGQLNRQGSLVGNLGVKINQADNLKEEVFVSYDGMADNQPGQADDKYFEKLVLKGRIAQEDKTLEIKSLLIDAKLGVSSTKKARDLTEPLNVLAEGDEIQYTLTLINSSQTALQNLLVGDIVPENVELDAQSIQCTGCKGELSLVETGVSMRPYLIAGIDLPAKATRTITYRVTVKSLPKVKIAVGQNLSSLYPVKDGYPDIAATPEGNPTGRIVYYYSISKHNATGQVNYGEYVSPDPAQNATTGYQPAKDSEGKTLGLDLTMFETKNADGVPLAVQHYFDYGNFPGLDLPGGGTNSGGGGGGGGGTVGDSISSLPGVGPLYDGIGSALDKAAEELEGAISMLTCSGGCIPMPINFAFLATGPINMMGVPVGYDPGTPIFGWGAPNPSTVCTGALCYASTGGRIYLSPTLTGKLAMAVCTGPYPVGYGPVPGNCYTIVLPVDPFAGLCDEIAGAMEGALGAANNMIADSSGTIGMSNDGSLADTPTADGKNYTGGFEAASSMGNYGFKVNAKTNIRMPGFPSVLTDWLDNQSSEIINKLTDLPDIYILLPDVMSPFRPAADGDSESAKGISETTQGAKKVGNETVSEKGLRGVLNEINKIPLIAIRPQEVIIKIPSLTPGEIDRFVNDAKQWVEDEKFELERVLAIWKCGPFKEMVPDPAGDVDEDGKPKMVPGYQDGTDAQGNPVIVYGDRPYNQVCDMITLDMTKLIQSVEKNIEIIEGYKQIPRQLLAWRNMLTKYVSQIICYIDAIIQFFVGNISKWLTQANAWVDAVATLVETIATWKLLFDLVIDYQTSCDVCTSSRFSLLELVLKLFAFIPSPPIIPFPKLPDLYLDFSQVQMGINILWPDIKFRPEKIVLPRLPRIVLPDLPVYNFTLPAIPLLPDLTLSLPELPDLPPLTLPALPNLPPPPKIPKLPGAVQATISILKKIFKILCLIKKGFIPTSETVLKTTIEHMTERGLDPLLPFDLGLAFQLPGISYNYVERIVLTVKIDLNKALEFSLIYDTVKYMADKLNAISTNFSAAANSLSKGLESAMATAAEGVNQSLDEAVPEGNAGEKPLLNWLPDEINNQLGLDPLLAAEFNTFAPALAESMAALNTVTAELETTMKQFEKMIEQDFQDIHLVAGTQTLRPNEAAANRTLEELENFDYSGAMLALGSQSGEFEQTRQLAGLRQNLLAFAQENARIDREIDLEMSGNGDISRVAMLLAEAPSLAETLEKSGFGAEKLMAAEPKLVAQVPSLNDLVNAGGLPASMQNQPAPKGMFIYNENQQVNEKLISYQEDLSLPNTMNFLDTDNDGDKDLVYSYGNNIYLKENYNKTGSLGQFYGGLPRYFDLETFVPAAQPVRNFKSGFNGNRTVDLRWKAAGGLIGRRGPADGGTGTGYEILIGPRLGGTAHQGVTSDLRSEGLLKLVAINSLAQVSALTTNSLLQPDPNSYNFPASRIHELTASEVNGEVRFDGPEQRVLVAGGQRLAVTGGQQIFAAADSVIKVFENGTERAPRKLAAREMITLPGSFGGKLEIALESGAVTVIDPGTIVENQRLLPGGKIDLNVRYRSLNNGSALIRLPENAYTRVDAGQSMEILVLDNPQKPALTLELENGFHYAVVRAFYRSGFRSLPSQSLLLAPNVCSDRQAPMPLSGPAERQVAIFKKLTIDASKSFDSFGEISSFYLDTDPETDSDGDGDKRNDRNLGRDRNPFVDSSGNGIPYDDLDDPVFEVGPYRDLNTRRVVLNVVDQSGNSSQQEITINIYVPLIFLDESSGKLRFDTEGNSGTVSGSLEPPESAMPLAIIRDRNGVKDLLRTPAADSNGKYFSDQDGKFVVEGLNLKDTVVIRDQNGQIIAEIDPATGRIVLKNPLYSVEALPAEEPLLPTRVVVKDPNGKIIATLFIVSNGLADVAIDGPAADYSAEAVKSFDGVRIKDLTAGKTPSYEINSLATDDQRFPGAVEILDSSNSRRSALLDKAGNFYIYDSRLKLNLKTAADLKEPMIFQVVNQAGEAEAKTTIAEFHITFSSKNPITILDPAQFKLFTEPDEPKGPKFDTDKDGMPDLWEQQYGLDFLNPADAAEDPDNDGLTNLDEYLAGTDPFNTDSDGDGYDDGFEKTFGRDPTSPAVSPFDDVNEDNPYYESIMNFFQRGILSGIPAGNRLQFGFNEPIERAEFAKVMLDTFCIVPRPQAYQSPGVFTDIPFSDLGNPWYFAPTKEAYFQGFITGYRGLIDQYTGRTPFAPEETITLAEAVKIILEALEREGIITLDKVPVTTPYYAAFMQVARDLEPYSTGRAELKSTFLLTAEEAAQPERDLNRGEFIKLADRVLTAYDCSLLDSDGDGMPDFWEEQQGLDPLTDDADGDPDGDGLTNLQEFKYGTDPLEADTDGGGVKDGEEVLKRQTNPLDPADDLPDSDGDGLTDVDETNKYGTDPFKADTDGGGVNDGDEVLINATNPNNALDDIDTDGDGLGDGEERLIYKTDYLNPDTDGGGVKDGAEVWRGTDPLDPADDLIDPKENLADGLYVIPAECFSCPCPAAIDHTADLIPGDRILAIISNNNNSQIFSQSNLVTITEVLDLSAP